MKEKLILIVKGFFVGIANIIPGVSGGTLALTLGIYEEMIGAISHFLSDIKKHLKFIIPLAIGAVLSILIGSKVITKSLDAFPFATTLFFIGLILGGIPLLTRKVKGKKIHWSNILVFLLTFLLVIGLGLLKGDGPGVSLTNLGVADYFLLFMVGVIAAATMVIPGVSGSMVLLLLGYYNPIIGTIEKLTSMTDIGSCILILAPFGIGVLVGIVGIAKLIEFLFKRFEIKTYYGVLGFVTASIITLFLPLLPVSAGVVQILVGLVLMFGGMLVGYKLGDE